MFVEFCVYKESFIVASKIKKILLFNKPISFKIIKLKVFILQNGKSKINKPLNDEQVSNIKVKYINLKHFLSGKQNIFFYY